MENAWTIQQMGWEAAQRGLPRVDTHPGDQAGLWDDECDKEWLEGYDLYLSGYPRPIPTIG